MFLLVQWAMKNIHSFKLDQKFIIHYTTYLNIKRKLMFQYKNINCRKKNELYKV
jgi:hypothetical protein